MEDQDLILGSLLDDLAAEAMVLEPGDLMTYGDVLSRLEQLIVVSEGLGAAVFLQLLTGLKALMEGMILGQVPDQAQGVASLTGGITLAQSLLRGESGAPEVADFLAAQGLAEGPAPAPAAPAPAAPADEPAAPADDPAPAAPEPTAAEAEAFADEDEELLAGFVTEALEHLQSIEVNVLLLEDTPEDQEILAAVFRPFHTIKGVSGFLNLLDINHLSHALENLLDQARAGRLTIEGQAIDVILAGVDMLRQMILEAQAAAQEKRPRRAFSTTALEQRVEAVIGGVAEGSAAPPRLGDVMVEKGLVAREAVEEALAEQRERPDRALGEILLTKGAAGPAEVAEGLKAQRALAQSRQVQAQEVKIDTVKLDNLLDMVGELVIAQSMVAANPRVQAINDRKLAADLSQLGRITTELQKTTMAMRMVPIKQTFQKMVRVVRDTAKKQNKLVRLVLEGESTEIDRNMVEKFYDPLVHMVRNSVDHGIEATAERAATGKPEEGTVTLAAYHKGGNVCIEIRDDGKGLNRDKIVEKAIERGLIDSAEGLSDEEVFLLIFEPGFSTADVVTDISGRGVGMDVVKRTMEELRGKIEIKSLPGQGTTFTIALPLTLAIIDGMVVEAGGERYILPTVAVVESLRPRREEYSTVQGRGEMIMIRGNLLPLVRLLEVVGDGAERVEPWDALVVVVEHHGQRRCLLVDRLIGRQEVVIKSLGESLKEVKVVAGGAIMGDGRVGLILDVEGVFKAHETKRV
ncbi:MAG: chemotaxis protein CheA [Thermodesulfobacteriota bacterium]